MKEHVMWHYCGTPAFCRSDSCLSISVYNSSLDLTSSVSRVDVGMGRASGPGLMVKAGPANRDGGGCGVETACSTSALFLGGDGGLAVAVPKLR